MVRQSTFRLNNGIINRTHDSGSSRNGQAKHISVELQVCRREFKMRLVVGTK